MSFKRLLVTVPSDRVTRHTFCEARFSCREVNRFVGTALDWALVGQLAQNAAYLTNVFWDALTVVIVLDARHLPCGWIA
jgi:hypothetical protein